MSEVQELQDQDQDDQLEGEMPEVEDQPAVEAEQDEQQQEPEAVEYVIAGEEPAAEPEQQAAERDWLKKLRADSRELARLKREREASQQSAVPALGPKPKAADFNFDTDLFEQALDQWHAAKAVADRHEAEQRAKAQAEAEQWNSTLRTYAQQKAVVAKSVPEFDELEAAVNERLTPAQQGVLLHVAGERAKIVAALGASPKALAKLAAIQDPLLLSAEIARMESSMTTAPQRKSPPPPERTVRGGGAGGAVASASRLEDLKAKAEKTGDSTEYWKALQAARAKA